MIRRLRIPNFRGHVPWEIACSHSSLSLPGPVDTIFEADWTKKRYLRLLVPNWKFEVIDYPAETRMHISWLSYNPLDTSKSKRTEFEIVVEYDSREAICNAICFEMQLSNVTGILQFVISMFHNNLLRCFCWSGATAAYPSEWVKKTLSGDSLSDAKLMRLWV